MYLMVIGLRLQRLWRQRLVIEARLPGHTLLLLVAVRRKLGIEEKIPRLKKLFRNTWMMLQHSCRLCPAQRGQSTLPRTRRRPATIWSKDANKVNTQLPNVNLTPMMRQRMRCSVMKEKRKKAAKTPTPICTGSSDLLPAPAS